MTSAGRVELEIPAESRFVATARNFVADAARAAGWTDEERLDDVRLVVSETVTNALHAHLLQRVVEPIRVSAEASADRLLFVVADAAGGFEPPQDAPVLPEPDLRQEGGFGLGLIEALSDETRFEATEEGTTVSVVLLRVPPTD